MKPSLFLLHMHGRALFLLSLHMPLLRSCIIEYIWKVSQLLASSYDRDLFQSQCHVFNSAGHTYDLLIQFKLRKTIELEPAFYQVVT
jgi:hypothetical protein